MTGVRRMSERRFYQYLGWLGALWEAKDREAVQMLDFAYFALRRDGFTVTG